MREYISIQEKEAIKVLATENNTFKRRIREAIGGFQCHAIQNRSK